MPLSPNTAATLATVVVLPSPGLGEVTITTGVRRWWRLLRRAMPIATVLLALVLRAARTAARCAPSGSARPLATGARRRRARRWCGAASWAAPGTSAMTGRPVMRSTRVAAAEPVVPGLDQEGGDEAEHQAGGAARWRSAWSWTRGWWCRGRSRVGGAGGRGGGGTARERAPVVDVVLQPVVVGLGVDLDRARGLQGGEAAGGLALVGEGLELLVDEAVLVGRPSRAAARAMASSGSRLDACCRGRPAAASAASSLAMTSSRSVAVLLLLVGRRCSR